jgi:hypothetical protein
LIAAAVIVGAVFVVTPNPRRHPASRIANAIKNGVAYAKIEKTCPLTQRCYCRAI